MNALAIDVHGLAKRFGRKVAVDVHVWLPAGRGALARDQQAGVGQQVHARDVRLR